MGKLAGKVAVVTGASKGIGAAIAERLGQEGASVVVNYASDKAGADKVAKKIEANGGKALVVKADVSKKEDISKLFGETTLRFGKVDILVNNAGMGYFDKTVEEMSGDEFRQTLETNLFGVFYGCHYAIPEMKKRGGGYILNISSLAGQNAHPRMAAYNASKFGLNGFSESLMQEVRHDDIKVSYICPGSVNTWFGGDSPSDDKAWQLQPADIAQTVIDLLEMDGRALPSKIEIRPSKPPAK